MFLVYYESRKRDVKTRPIYECRYDERLITKSEKSTRLGYTGLFGKLEHLKIKTRLIELLVPEEKLRIYHESRKRELKDKTYI
jgi:hypothetical protein